MYKIEPFQNMTTMEDFAQDYKNAAGFLDYCEKWMGYKQIWSCPLYDFDPEEYKENYKYLYLIGTKIIFDRDGGDGMQPSKEYINQACLKEKESLCHKVQALEKKYPGSTALAAGSCHMCSRCARSVNKGCRYSDDIRYFLESLGTDVGRTAGDFLGIQLQLMKQRPPEYFNLINGLLTDDPEIDGYDYSINQIAANNLAALKYFAI